MAKAFPLCVGLVGLLLGTSLQGAIREAVIEPAYVANFKGEVAYDVSRAGQGEVRADTRPSGAPSRIVMEFKLPENTTPEMIARATFSIITLGWASGSGPLDISLFAYGGDGTLSVGEGLDGSIQAGPYDSSDDTNRQAFSRVDVLAFVRMALSEGHDHVGFALRDTVTEANYQSDGISFNTARSSFAGSRPPLLVLHLSDEALGEAAVSPVARSLSIEDFEQVAEAATAEGGLPSPLYHWTMDPVDLDRGFGISVGSVVADPLQKIVGPGSLRCNNDGYYLTTLDGPAGSTPRTTSLWFRTSATTEDTDTLLGWGGSSFAQRYDLRLIRNALRIDIGSAGYTFNQIGNLQDQQWHHLLLSYAGGPISNHDLFIDGQHVGRASGSTVPNTGTREYINIGSGVQQSDGGGYIKRDFSGWIDDVAIFNEPLEAPDVALLHGIGRHLGLDVTAFEAFHLLFEGPEDGIVTVPGSAWIKADDFSGSMGSTAGSVPAGDATIVIDENGRGIRTAVPAETADFVVLDGTVDQSSGFGKTATVSPVLRQSGSGPAVWQLIWDDPASVLSLENLAANLAARPEHFLDSIPDPIPYQYAEYTNRIYFGGNQIDHTEGAVVEGSFGRGSARYFTLDYAGVLAVVADIKGVEDLSLSDDFRDYPELSEFPVTAPDGTAYRACYEARKGGYEEDADAVHDIIVVPDVPSLSSSIQPFRVGGLPENCRIYHLSFRRVAGQQSAAILVEQVVRRFFETIANGPTWAFAETPVGVVEPDADTAIAIGLDATGLEPGVRTTRYAIAPFGTRRADLPAAAWHELNLRVGEPDFTLPEPVVNPVILAGVTPEAIEVALKPVAGGPLTVVGLESDQSWASARVSPTSPNGIELNFDPSGLAAGSYTAWIAIDTASTRQRLQISLTVQEQSIVRMEPDFGRNRIYALHRPETGPGRLLAYAGADGRLLASLELAELPEDLSLNPDGDELLVYHKSGLLWRIDPETLKRKGLLNLKSLAKPESVLWASVAAGPDGIAYLATPDVYYEPGGKLRVISLIDGSVLQQLEPPTELLYDATRRALFTWDEPTVTRFEIDPDGRLEQVDVSLVDESSNHTGNTDRRLHLSRDGRRLVVNEQLVDPDQLGDHRVIYPYRIGGTTPNVEVVTSTFEYRDPNTYETQYFLRLMNAQNGETIADYEVKSSIQAVAPDYSRIFYYNLDSKQVESVETATLTDAASLGLRFEPADGMTILPPDILRWIPQEDAEAYHVYVAGSADDLSAVTPVPGFQVGSPADAWLEVDPASWPLSEQQFWRVDTLLSDGSVLHGEILSFKVAGLVVEPRSLKLTTAEGIDGRIDTLEVSSMDPSTPWTATGSDSWVVPTVRDGLLEVRIDASSLAAGDYYGSITLQQGTDLIEIPVTAWVRPIELQQVIPAPGTPFVYVRSEYREQAFMLRFNTDEERYDRVTELPSLGNFIYTTLSRSGVFHPADGKIYMTYGNPTSIATFDPIEFQLEGDPRPVGGLGDTSGYSSSSPLVAGPAGRLLLGTNDTWLIDTETMSAIGPPLLGPEDTAVLSRSYDRVGQFLYLDVRRTDGGTWLANYRLENDELIEVSSIPVSSYSYTNGEPLLISPDGGRIYRGREIYDGQLQEVGRNRPDFPYFREFRPLTCTEGGEFVTDGSFLFNGTNGLDLGILPGASGPYTAIASDQRRLIQFNWRDPGFAVTDLQEMTALGGTDVVPGIPDGSILFNASLPLTWQADARAVAYRVFVGSDEQTVRSATVDDPEFAGETDRDSIPPPFPLRPDEAYFWRVDIVGYSGTHTGQPFAFRTAPIDVLPLNFSFSGLVGLPLGEQSITLESGSAVKWTASSTTPWIRIEDEAGTSPGTLRFHFDTTDLGADTHEGTITLSAGGKAWDYPVSLTLETANIVMARFDADRNRILAISQSGDDNRYRDRLFNAYLVSYDAATGEPLRSIPAGSSVSDLVVHDADNRLYLAHWKTGEVRALDLDTFEEEALFQYFPYDERHPEAGEVQALTPWIAGRLLMSGPGNPTKVRIIDTSDGKQLDAWRPEPLAIGPGTRTILPGGRYCIHSEQPYTNNNIFKVDLSGDTISGVTRNFHPGNYDSAPSLSPVLLSGDGQRIYSGRGLFDTDLNLMETLPSYAIALVPGEQFLVATDAIYNLATGVKVRDHDGGQTLLTTHDRVWSFSRNKPLPSGYSYSEALNFKPGEKIAAGIDQGTTVIGTGRDLSWTPDPRAAGYRIYFGTDREAVVAAGPGSPEDLGFTTGSSISAPLTLDTEFFWRIDAIGHGGTHPGGVNSFRTAPIEIDPAMLRIAGLQGVPIPDHLLSISAPSATAWNATAAASWLTLLGAPGVTPGTLSVQVDPSGFGNGQTFSSQIRFTAAGGDFNLPVEAALSYPEPIHAAADQERPLVYFTTGHSNSSQPAFLIVVDAVTEQPIEAIKLGTGAASHVAVNYAENLIYVTNSTLGQVFVLDRDSFDVVRTLPSSRNVDPGRPGRAVLTGRSSFSVRLPLVDTESGAELSQSFFDGHPYYWDLQEGSGTFDPDGRHFYYGEYDGDLIRFDTADDRLTHDAAFIRGEGNPGRHILRNDAGTRYFWGGHMLDENLNLMWDFSQAAPGNYGNFARQVDAEGDRIFAWDTLEVIRVLDVKRRRYLFGLHQSREGDALAYSPVTNKLFDMTVGRVSAVRFEPVIEPIAGPPDLVWANGGPSPWKASTEEPGVMVSTPLLGSDRASLCTVHIPTKATLTFRGRGRFWATFDEDWNNPIQGGSEWRSYQMDIPAGGHFVTWYADGNSESDLGYIRDIAILRNGPIRMNVETISTGRPSDPTLDEDGDGVADIIEWMTGGNASDPRIGFPITTSVEGTEFVIQFKRRLDLEGGSLVLEGSPDLNSWQAYGFPEVLQIDIDATYETLEARFPLDGNSHYFRLNASVAP